MLGDGYEVSLRFGLNNVRPEWALTWETTAPNADTIDEFLQARADAGEAFDWVPPDVSCALRWRCEEWSVEHLAFNWVRVTATFRQVFEIGGAGFCEFERVDFCESGSLGGGFSLISTGSIITPIVGDILTAPISGLTKYYRNDPAAPGGSVFLSEGPAYTITTGDVDYTLYGEVEVPSNILPSGYYPPIRSTPTGVVQEPGPRDGTYDAGGRTVTITGTRVGSYTVTGCFAPTSSTAPINVSSTFPGTNVASITVEGLDWTGGDGVQCGGPGTVGNYVIGDFRVFVAFSNGSTTQALLLANGLVNLFQESMEWSEVRNVTVEFADDPGNPVPLESLPRLS
jgi:phage-related protein